jgi:hypothetical protein
MAFSVGTGDNQALMNSKAGRWDQALDHLYAGPTLHRPPIFLPAA